MSRTGSTIWRDLLRSALACLDSLPARGVQPPEWTLGGGTVLMLRYEHRLSRDIDIFLDDPQYLTLLSPRLNETAASLTDSYLEASNHLKLAFDVGEIDFIVAPDLTSTPPAALAFEDRTILLDSPAEIVAKKLFYRAESLKVRDLFDAGLVLLKEPDAAAVLRPIVATKREQLGRRLRLLQPTLDARLQREADLMPAGRTIAAEALDAAGRFVESL